MIINKFKLEIADSKITCHGGVTEESFFTGIIKR